MIVPTVLLEPHAMDLILYLYDHPKSCVWDAARGVGAVDNSTLRTCKLLQAVGLMDGDMEPRQSGNGFTLHLSLTDKGQAMATMIRGMVHIMGAPE